MTRRLWMLLPAALLRADERQDIVDWLGAWVQRLTEENASEFLGALDKTLRERVETDIRALVRNNELASSIGVLTIREDGSRRIVELDWFLSIKPHSSTAASVQRRQRITMTLDRVKKGWQVSALAPESFFSPLLNG